MCCHVMSTVTIPQQHHRSAHFVQQGKQSIGMGTAASIADGVDKTLFDQVTAGRYGNSVFEHFCDSDRYITKERLIFLAQQTDVYLAHDWDSRNFVRVQAFNHMLKEKNLITWCSEEELPCDYQDSINTAIDNTRVVVVFITKPYVDRISSTTTANKNATKLEFGYACRRKGPQRMIAVILDECCADPTQWYVATIGFYL
jgi:hypothetical protein